MGTVSMKVPMIRRRRIIIRITTAGVLENPSMNSVSCWGTLARVRNRPKAWAVATMMNNTAANSADSLRILKKVCHPISRYMKMATRSE